MRKLRTVIVLSVIFTLGGCVKDLYVLETLNVDLTQFSKKGMFVTTGDIPDMYKSISLLSTICYNGYSEKGEINISEKDRKYFDEMYGTDYTPISKRNYSFKACNSQELFNEMINEAKELGADAIIKMEIKKIQRVLESPKRIQEGIEVSGLAIKLLE